MSDYLEIARRVLRERGDTATTESTDSLVAVLQGKAVELYLAEGDRLFIVADKEDALRLGKPKVTVVPPAASGQAAIASGICRGSEVRRVIQIEDPATVYEIHEWKRTFSGRIRE